MGPRARTVVGGLLVVALGILVVQVTAYAPRVGSDGAAVADLVFGQPNFTTRGDSGTALWQFSPTSLYAGPNMIAIDDSGVL